MPSILVWNILPPNLYLVKYKTIAEYQKKDSILLDLAKNNEDYTIDIFHGGGKKQYLICKNIKIINQKY